MKPKSHDGINYVLHGCAVKFLTEKHTILATDFVRDIYEDSWVDAGWSRAYRSENWRGTMWHLAEDDLSGWVGKTYEDYMKFSGAECMMHEIVRVIK